MFPVAVVMAISFPSSFSAFQPLARGQQPLATKEAETDAPVSTNKQTRVERQSAQQTADNMLGFIANDIRRLKSEGASPERISERLAAARQGIEKGYEEAEAILQAKGVLTDELKEEVNEGRRLIEEGLKQLEQGKDIQTASPQSVTDSTEIQTSAQSTGRFSQLQAANAMSLELTTRDGDAITVSFAQSAQAQGSQTESSLNLLNNRHQHYQMTVEGHLDDDERSAIEQLFKSVQDLSERFFAGDLAGAMDEAMQLGFDSKELASLSLKLTQKTSAASHGYASSRPQLPTPALQQLKAPVASYVDSYLQAVEKAHVLKEPATLIDSMVQRLLPDEERMPVWQAFHQGLNDLHTLHNTQPSK